MVTTCARHYPKQFIQINLWVDYLIATLWDSLHYYCLFTNEVTETQKLSKLSKSMDLVDFRVRIQTQAVGNLNKILLHLKSKTKQIKNSNLLIE